MLTLLTISAAVNFNIVYLQVFFSDDAVASQPSIKEYKYSDQDRFLSAPGKQKKKCGIDQILTSACCPQQNEHVDIKKVACNHVTAILERCHKAKNISLFFLLLLFVRLFISTRFPRTVADTDIITLLEPLWTTDMSFGGHKTETKDLGGIFATKSIFDCSPATQRMKIRINEQDQSIARVELPYKYKVSIPYEYSKKENQTDLKHA